MDKKFVRSRNRKIAGVCSGIAEYFDIDPIIVRAIFLALIFCGGSGFVLYLILLILMPDANKIYTPYDVIHDDPSSNAQASSDQQNVNDEKSDSKENNYNKEMENIIRKNDSSVPMVIGLLLILIGCSLLIHYFCPISIGKFYFPLLVILAGVIIILVGVTKKNK